MKDHERARIHNELRDVARMYANTEQLRARLAAVIAPVYEEIEQLQDNQCTGCIHSPAYIGD